MRLKDYNYSQSGYYYVTILVKNRECIFGKVENDKMVLNEFGIIAKKYWEEIPLHYENVEINEYIIMPNHIHGIICIDLPDADEIHESNIQSMTAKQRRKMTIPLIIGRFKMTSAKQINLIRNMQGIPFWQRNYYEHIIRDDKDLNRIREYIINNPCKWENDKNKSGENL